MLGCLISSQLVGEMLSIVVLIRGMSLVKVAATSASLCFKLDTTVASAEFPFSSSDVVLGFLAFLAFFSAVVDLFLRLGVVVGSCRCPRNINFKL